MRGTAPTMTYQVGCGNDARRVAPEDDGSYKAGDEFEVAAGQIHTEAVGPEGTCVTTGRKY